MSSIMTLRAMPKQSSRLLMPSLLIAYCGLVGLAPGMQLDPGALVPLYGQALEEREKQFGTDHPKVARSASDLGLYLRNIGDGSAAAPYLARAVDIHARILSASSRQFAEDLENLAAVSPPEQALELYRKA